MTPPVEGSILLFPPLKSLLPAPVILFASEVSRVMTFNHAAKDEGRRAIASHSEGGDRAMTDGGDDGDDEEGAS